MVPKFAFWSKGLYDGINCPDHLPPQRGHEIPAEITSTCKPEITSTCKPLPSIWKASEDLHLWPDQGGHYQTRYLWASKPYGHVEPLCEPCVEPDTVE